MSGWNADEITVNGINIHIVRTGGDKPAVVLSHGVTDYGRSWQRVARELAPAYDVIMYDQRGHGRSDAPPTGYAAADHARDLAGLIAALDLTHPHIVGHSGGAAAAAVLAAAHPDLPASLTLVDPPWGRGWGGDWESMSAGITQWFRGIIQRTREELTASGRHSNPHWSEEDLTHWVESKLQVHPNVAQGFDQPAPPWLETVRKITCPILLISGDPAQGGIMTPKDVQEMAAVWQKGVAVRVDGAGHAIHYDQFAPFVAAVKAFLAHVSGQ